MSRNSILDTGDAVSSGDAGGFGNTRRSVEIVKYHAEHVHLGADALPEGELVDEIRRRLVDDGIDVQRLEFTRDGRTVVIRGAVASVALRDAVESIALGTPGVVQVRHTLLVDPDQV